MSTLWVLFYACLLCEVAIGAWNLLRLSRLRRHLLSAPRLEPEDPQPHIVFVIPMLREQDLAESTLTYFGSLALDPARTRIVVVTTERETLERRRAEDRLPALVSDLVRRVPAETLAVRYGDLLPASALRDLSASECGESSMEGRVRRTLRLTPSTADRVRAAACKVNARVGFGLVQHVHYPEVDGLMADQVNHALRNLDPPFATDRCYLALFNADSRPDPRTITELRREVSAAGFPPVIQQYSVYTAAWEERSGILQAAAILQSNLELRAGLANARFESRCGYSYVMGHGLFVRVDFLREIGGLSTDFWCEDIHLSCLLRAMGVRIHALSVVERAEVPAHFSSLVKQGAVWFRTASRGIGIWRDVVRRRGRSDPAGLVWLAHRVRMTAGWLLGPFIVSFTFIFPLVLGAPLPALAALAGYLVMISGIHVGTTRAIRAAGDEQVRPGVLGFCCLCVYFLLSGLGPLYAIATGARSRVLAIPPHKFKTIR